MSVRSPVRSSKKSVNHAQLFFEPYTPLDFGVINQRARYFANHIEAHFEEIADILLDYESFEVIQDETSRALDLLRHLEENQQFFCLRIGEVTSFLPRNQPLYALSCFAVVPSLMASEVHFRIPHCMRHFFPRFLRALKLNDFFPNIFPSRKERIKFLQERSATRINPKSEESIPVTDAVIFTGTSHHAEKLRLIFDQRSLFIANGAGHNPLVIAEDALISKSVEAAITLQLYNQGQDCAAPNAILVHHHSYEPFMRVLHEELRKVKVGHYRDRSCRVGPISEPRDLERIQTLLIDNRPWLDPLAPGIIRTSQAVIEPTVICKPLRDGGNFSEVFAPVFFVQEYLKDSDLSLYFEDAHYARNAMYVTLFGSSDYVDALEGRIFAGKVLHDRASIIRNTHLHAPGIERGTQPYGGYGYAASSVAVQGKIFCKPTLPQRDIYQYVCKPLLDSPERMEEKKLAINSMKRILVKDVRKIFGLKTETQKNEMDHSSEKYIDASIISRAKQRYVRLPSTKIFTMLDGMNLEHIAKLEPITVHQIRSLKKLLARRRKPSEEILSTFLYSIGRRKGKTIEENRSAQLQFFKHLYHLLFGVDHGPRLAQFLLDADRRHVLSLLDI